MAARHTLSAMPPKWNIDHAESLVSVTEDCVTFVRSTIGEAMARLARQKA
jgi:hypothetical protein